MDNKDKNASTSQNTTNQDAATNPGITNHETSNQNGANQAATNLENTNQDESNQISANRPGIDQDTSNQTSRNPQPTDQDASQMSSTPQTMSQDVATQISTSPQTIDQDDNQMSTRPPSISQDALYESTSSLISFSLHSIVQDPSIRVVMSATTTNDQLPTIDQVDTAQTTIRKAARFDPATPIPATTLTYTRRLSDDRELDADMFETVLFHVGEFGRYQKLLLLAIIPFALYFSWVYFSPMFLVITPRPFWCKVPELSHLSKDLRRDLSAPGATHGHWDGCKVYDVDWNTVLSTMKPPPPNTPLVPCRTGWEHDYKEIPYETVVSERGWVCDRATYSLTSQSAFFAGSFAGGLTFGWMADTYGRVPALIGVNVFGGAAGMVTIFTVGAWDFILCRFFYGMAYDNCFMIAYILVLEYVGPKHRTLVANLPLVLFDGTGAVTLPWIAYFIANWRWFSAITSASMFVGVFTPWLLPESARWLISRGRVDEAVKVLKRFEKVNKTHVPDFVLNKFINSSIEANKRQKDSFSSMFKSELLRQTVIFMAVAYCFLAVAYDALVRVSESFGFDFFITFTINAFVEIPSVIMVALLLDRLGRRNLTFGPTVLGAIFIVITMFVPKGAPRVCVAVAARFLINLSYTVSVQWVAEILPTPFRATGSAAMHMCGFAFSLFSPLIVYSGHYWSLLPLVILVVLSLVAAAFCLLVPETKGEEMPQTIADAESIIKENSLYGRAAARSMSRAFSSVRSTTFIEPIQRSPEGRVSIRLSRTIIHN